MGDRAASSCCYLRRGWEMSSNDDGCWNGRRYGRFRVALSSNSAISAWADLPAVDPMVATGTDVGSGLVVELLSSRTNLVCGSSCGRLAVSAWFQVGRVTAPVSD